MTPVADKPKYDEDAAFDRIMTACRAAEAKGWRIASGHFFEWRHGVKYCCPLGAFLVEEAEPSLAHGVGQPSDIGKAVRLWRRATGIYSAYSQRYFTNTIDYGINKSSGRRRAARLARRVRAALWPDGAP